MIAALNALKSAHEPLPQQFAAFGIADGSVARGLQKLWMSHPPLDERIAALRALPVGVA
jgi:heat shock protein HtpX